MADPVYIPELVYIDSESQISTFDYWSLFFSSWVDKKQVPVLLLDLGEEYFIYFQALVKRKLFITKIHETFMGIFRTNVIK